MAAKAKQYTADADVKLNIPAHIGFIMDGNGRWGTRRGLTRSAGHAKGALTLRKIVEYCIELQIKTTTFYAFSTENWKRSREEVGALLALMDKYLDEYISKLAKYDVEVRFMGDKSKFDAPLVRKMLDIESGSIGKRMNLNIAMNYGGRAEIVNAVNRAAEKKSGFPLTEEDVERELYTYGQDDPDLIIRTAGEMRISNFLLWQSAYSEFWFTNKLWPDFSRRDLDKAISDYSLRKRNYGGV